MLTEITKPPVQSAATLEETNENPVSAFVSKESMQCGTATIADGQEGLSNRHIEILEQRKINVELAIRLGWHTRNATGDLCIPFYQEGREVNHKLRSLEGNKKFSQKKGGKQIFYNVDALKEAHGGTVVITEGEMDCLVALDCGHLAVSVPSGAPAEVVGDKASTKYDFLEDFPRDIKNIILAVDSDEAGMNLRHDLSIRLGKHRCLWVEYPDGCKDLNETLISTGREGVEQVFKNKKQFKIDGLYRLSDLPPIPKMPALSVHIEELKDNLRLRRGDFSVVTGIPSHGKSTFANHLAFNMAKEHQWHVCFASFEQPPQTEHKDALSTLYTGKPAYTQTSEQLSEAESWIEKNISFIVPDDEQDEWADLHWLKERMAFAVTRFDAKMFVIDPWNELDHVYDQREVSMTQYVGTAIKELKRFARRYCVHVMVVAHPAKMRKDKDGIYPVPTAYDISDSSHWYNKPEQIIIVHRQSDEESGDHTLIRIAKSRYHNALGKPGDVKLKFDDYHGKFVSVPNYG